MDEILKRFWENLIGRASGPMHLRLMVQPIVASVLAIRSGLKDAREGRPAFLWAVIMSPTHRPGLLLHSGWDVGKVFVLAAALDAIYQLVIQRRLYLLEMLVVATVLAIIPYVLIRGPVNRFASALCKRKERARSPEIITDHHSRHDR